MSDAVFLRCEGIEKTFARNSRRTEVLRDINLEMREGELIAILGQSGVGKSTLLHVLGTLEPATSGRLFYNGEDVRTYSAARLARFRNETLGFIFQFHYLLQEFTALENVLMPALVAGEPKEKYESVAKELLDEVGLSHRMDHRPGELSGGEQQRVAVARALIMNPKLVLADEPTGNLDTENAGRVKEILLELNRSRGVTLALVTHDREIAADFPRQIVMRDGQIISQ